MLNKLKTGLFVALCLLAGASYADLNEAQHSVWEVVEQSWVDDVARNGKWPANYVHDEVVNWGEEWPTPREKASMIKWNRFYYESDARILMYELFPAAIVVVGDTAVVSYNVVTIEEDAKKESVNPLVWWKHLYGTARPGSFSGWPALLAIRTIDRSSPLVFL